MFLAWVQDSGWPWSFVKWTFWAKGNWISWKGLQGLNWLCSPECCILTCSPSQEAFPPCWTPCKARCLHIFEPCLSDTTPWGCETQWSLFCSQSFVARLRWLHILCLPHPSWRRFSRAFHFQIVSWKELQKSLTLTASLHCFLKETWQWDRSYRQGWQTDVWLSWPFDLIGRHVALVQFQFDVTVRAHQSNRKCPEFIFHSVQFNSSFQLKQR